MGPMTIPPPTPQRLATTPAINDQRRRRHDDSPATLASFSCTTTSADVDACCPAHATSIASVAMVMTK
eukprot:2343987-Amphidinium_carterae.1